MSFSSFNLNNKLVNNLSKIGYKDPTETQKKVIPLLLKKQSLFLNAPTGSGKTHTFLIPIFSLYKQNKLGAIIVLPTLELVHQTENFVKKLCQFYNDFKYKVVVKEDDLNIKYTPNLLIVLQSQFDKLNKTSSFNFNDLDFLIFDEVDMLIENDILNFKPFKNSRICFVFVSTSLDVSKVQKIRNIYKNVSLMELNFNNKNVGIKHVMVDVGHGNRLHTLKDFIKYKNPYFCLIFASQNKTVKEIYSYLKNEKFNVCYLSKDLNKSQRKNFLQRISKDEFQYVVLSDLGARGIDFKNVSDVISFDFPFGFSKEYYLHRAGRTGRNGAKGNSYIFYNSDDMKTKTFLDDLNVDVLKMVFKNNDLKEKKTFVRSNRNNEEVEKLIKQEKSKIRNGKKVKPNYKKKMKKAIEKAKGKYRREIIEKDIRRQKVERYKKEAKYE